MPTELHGYQRLLMTLVLCGAVAAIMVHVPGTLLLVHYLGFAGAGWAVVVMRTAHLSFTVGQSPQCFHDQL